MHDDKKKFIKIDKTVIGSLLTFIAAVLFGLLGKATEMGLIVVAGAVGLAFFNLDKIERFKGAGFEAEMKRAVEEANATVEQLRQVAATSAEVMLTDLMASNFMSGVSLEKRMELHDRTIKNLKEIGASTKQIKKVDHMWQKGLKVIFYRGILKTIEEEKKRQKNNSDEEIHYIHVLQDFRALFDGKTWRVPSATKLRELCEKRKVINSKIDELLKDYEEFEKSGKFRRKYVFLTL